MSIALPQAGAGRYELAPYKSLDNDVLQQRIAAVRAALGPQLLILGHHYQQDEVIAMSDLRGDSYQLSKMAAESGDCRAIAFCGVHFMAETADILANQPAKLAARGGQRVTVVLPDMAAGCSMADMAAIEQVESAWEELGEVIDTQDITPVTYINSAASLKAFCGRHGGIVCTSSNAAAVLEWAFERTSRVLFFPDQHLGRNTAKAMGIPLEQMPVWDPFPGRTGRQHARGARGQQSAAVARPLQRAPDVHRGARRSVPREDARHQDPGASRVPDGSGRQGRRAGLDRQDHSRGRSRCRPARSGPSAPSCTWSTGSSTSIPSRRFTSSPRSSACAPRCIASTWPICAGAWRTWRPARLSMSSQVDDETARWSLVALRADAGGEVEPRAACRCALDATHSSRTRRRVTVPIVPCAKRACSPLRGLLPPKLLTRCPDHRIPRA